MVCVNQVQIPVNKLFNREIIEKYSKSLDLSYLSTGSWLIIFCWWYVTVVTLLLEAQISVFDMDFYRCIKNSPISSLFQDVFYEIFAKAILKYDK